MDRKNPGVNVNSEGGPMRVNVDVGSMNVHGGQGIVVGNSNPPSDSKYRVTRTQPRGKGLSPNHDILKQMEARMELRTNGLRQKMKEIEARIMSCSTEMERLKQVRTSAQKELRATSNELSECDKQMRNVERMVEFADKAGMKLSVESFGNLKQFGNPF